MILYVATSNAGKLRDFAVAAQRSAALRIEPLPGLAAMAAPPEDQLTFEGNARLKASYYSSVAKADALVVADDSGLEADALGGQPGVHSARYAALAGSPGRGTTDERNNQHLLSQLARCDERGARYRCVLALARSGAVLLTAHGVVEGEILASPRGTGGFGYDPIFYLPQLGRSMAELDAATRLELSHRGRALHALMAALEEQGMAQLRSAVPPGHKDDGRLS